MDRVRGPWEINNTENKYKWILLIFLKTFNDTRSKLIFGIKILPVKNKGHEYCFGQKFVFNDIRDYRKYTCNLKKLLKKRLLKKKVLNMKNKVLFLEW